MAAVDPNVPTPGYQSPGMGAGTDAHKFLIYCGAERIYCTNTIILSQTLISLIQVAMFTCVLQNPQDGAKSRRNEPNLNRE